MKTKRWYWSEESRAKMLGNKNGLGYLWSPEQKTKLLGNKNALGRIAWNKGLTKETDEKVAKVSIRMIGNKYVLGNKYSLGHKHTAEAKIKMSMTRIGNRYALGKHWILSSETKAKMRKGKLGPNNPSWRGGNFEPYGLEFDNKLKFQIRQRDNFVCQFLDCAFYENGRKHHIHHIDYNKKNDDPKNLITLCAKHHSQTISGNRNYWTEYYQELQILRGM